MKKVLIILFAFIAFTAKSQVQINESVSYQGDSIHCYSVITDVTFDKEKSEINYHIKTYATKAKYQENKAYNIEISMIPTYLSKYITTGNDYMNIAKNDFKDYLLSKYSFWSSVNVIIEQ